MPPYGAPKAELRKQIDVLLGDVDALLIEAREARHPFLRACRRVLDRVCAMRAAEPFMQPVTGVRGYAAVVAEPMCFSQIRAKLLATYGSAQQFVDDMRLVVANCYAFNGEESPLLASARDLELTMEDAFVSELGLPRPNPAEISARCRAIDGETKRRLMHTICLYEKMQEDARNFQFTPDLLRPATIRAVLVLLRRAAATSSAAAAQQGQPPPRRPAVPAATAVAERTAPPPPRTFQRPALGVKRSSAVVRDDEEDDIFHNVDPGPSSLQAAAPPAPPPPPAQATSASPAPPPAAAVSAAHRPVPIQQNSHNVGFLASVSPVHSPADASDHEHDLGGFSSPFDN